VNAPDQHGRASRRDPGPPPSAMRPWTPGSWALEIHGRGTDGEGGSGYADRPARLLACDLRFHGSCSLSQSPHLYFLWCSSEDSVLIRGFQGVRSAGGRAAGLPSLRPVGRRADQDRDCRHLRPTHTQTHTA